MKVIYEKNDVGTQAQLDFLRMLEQSGRPGQALWHPQVADRYPAPDCLVVMDQICSFALTFLDGLWAVDHGDWWRRGDGAVSTPMDNPLETAWRTSEGVRLALRGQTGMGCYIIPVVVFVDMESDSGIQQAVQDRGVRILWGVQHSTDALVDLPSQEQLQHYLDDRIIELQIAAVRRQPGHEIATPETAHLDLEAGQLVIQHADVVNIYVTVGSDGNFGLAPPDDRSPESTGTPR